MINQNKWINSLPKRSMEFAETNDQINHSKWTNTIPQKNNYNNYNNYAWKYSLLAASFVCGLLFVSVIKNETRNLEKEIANLRTSNKEVKFDLDQAKLDNEVITSPENIARLAKEHLNTNFIFYKKSQIAQLNEDTKSATILNKKDNNLKKKIKVEIAKKIQKKKTEIKKLQELYSKPGSIPGEIKVQIASKIKEKKGELETLYTSPKKTITLEKAQKWATIQVVKLFLGIPVVPGR